MAELSSFTNGDTSNKPSKQQYDRIAKYTQVGTYGVIVGHFFCTFVYIFVSTFLQESTARSVRFVVVKADFFNVLNQLQAKDYVCSTFT